MRWLEMQRQINGGKTETAGSGATNGGKTETETETDTETNGGATNGGYANNSGRQQIEQKLRII